MLLIIISLICALGALRSSKQDVLEQQQCAKNEEFSECGSACEPSCRHPTPTVCTLQCVIGCQCKHGFFRNDHNECVANCNSTEDYDPISSHECPENEKFNECGAACEPTCDNPNPVCTKQCVLNVCQCRDGFVRNSWNHCVPKSACSLDSSALVPSSCSDVDCPAGSTCSMVSVECRVPPCAASMPNCIPDITEHCEANESWRDCSTCEPSCTDMNPSCPLMCGIPQCQCNPGFFRSALGKCITMDECRRPLKVVNK